MAIKVKVYVAEIDNVMLLFDVIQVQRSKLGSPFSDAENITADTAQSPVLVGTEEGPFDLQGKTVKLKVDGGLEQEVTFTLPDPISLANVIGEFNDAIVGATADDDGEGKLKIEGGTSGTGGSLEITGGTGLTELGLTSGDIDNGEDAHVTLVSGTSDYEYDDEGGEASYWYRTRYYNTVSGNVSSYSDWMQGDTGSVIDAAELIVGKIRLADLDGGPMVDAKVTIVNTFIPQTADSYFISGGAIQLETNGVGYAEVNLVRGAIVDVIIGGTSVVRRIQVPSTGTEFDLMDEGLVLDDAFQIQVPDLPVAVRRS